MAELEKAYAHWQSLYDHGGSDPTWPDGVNLNLVRGHITIYKRQIEENCPLYMTHELYQRPLPPKMDDNYMARADEIREHARQSLQAYLADQDYRYLLRHKESLSSKIKKEGWKSRQSVVPVLRNHIRFISQMLPSSHKRFL